MEGFVMVLVGLAVAAVLVVALSGAVSMRGLYVPAPKR